MVWEMWDLGGTRDARESVWFRTNSLFVSHGRERRAYGIASSKKAREAQTELLTTSPSVTNLLPLQEVRCLLKAQRREDNWKVGLCSCEQRFSPPTAPFPKV